MTIEDTGEWVTKAYADEKAAMLRDIVRTHEKAITMLRNGRDSLRAEVERLKARVAELEAERNEVVDCLDADDRPDTLPVVDRIIDVLVRKHSADAKAFNQAGEIERLSARVAELEAEAGKEREHIVAWLDRESVRLRNDHGNASRYLDGAADAIKRGDHDTR